MTPIRLRPRPPQERGARRKTMRRGSTSTTRVKNTRKMSTSHPTKDSQPAVVGSIMTTAAYFQQPSKAYISPYSSSSGTPTEADSGSSGSITTSEDSRSEQETATTTKTQVPTFFHLQKQTPYISPYTSASEGSIPPDEFSAVSKKVGMNQQSSAHSSQPCKGSGEYAADISKIVATNPSLYQWSPGFLRVSRYPYGSPADSVDLVAPTINPPSAPIVVEEPVSRRSLRRQYSDATEHDSQPDKASKKVAWAETDEIHTFSSFNELQETDATDSDIEETEESAVSYLVPGPGLKNFIQNEMWKGLTHKPKFETRQLGNYFEIPVDRQPNPHPRIKSTTVTLEEWQEIWEATQNELFRRVQCLNCHCTHWDHDFKVEWTIFRTLHNEMIAWNTGTPENFMKLRNLLRIIERKSLGKNSPCMQEEYFSLDSWAKIEEDDAYYHVWKKIMKPDEGWPQQRTDDDGRIIYETWDDVMMIGEDGEAYKRQLGGEPEGEPQPDTNNAATSPGIPTTISAESDIAMTDVPKTTKKKSTRRNKRRGNRWTF